MVEAGFKKNRESWDSDEENFHGAGEQPISDDDHFG
jgi:hypothetical protein